VGIGAVVQHVGQVAVQDNAEAAEGVGHRGAPVAGGSVTEGADFGHAGSEAERPGDQ
jgi:hypothetical protein